MRITPLDIQQKQFPIKFRGFDVEEVYAFLEVIREEMEDLLRENASLKEQIHRAEQQLQEYRDMENTLRETLMTAQQMVEDYKNNARKEAELIIREAELRADAMIKEAQEKVIKIHEDIVDLKGIRRHFKEELKRLIESHLMMLDFDEVREEEAKEAEEPPAIQPLQEEEKYEEQEPEEFYLSPPFKEEDDEREVQDD
ncbi:MAG TPA: DivIVA domain-containing protein [Nitrospirae bacterium]|nr:DivIVA domain-containing protein [Nitrospirota bacterium]